MNDSGITRALLNTGLLSPNGSAAPQIKLLELPSALQKQSVISGEVVANKNGEVTMKTPQGNVVFEANVNVAIGQKITLKLQVVMQNTQRNLLVELTSIAGQPVKAPPVQTQPIQVQPLQPNLLQPQPVTVDTPGTQQILPVLADDPLEQFPLLQSKLVQLPKAVSQEALDILMKEILNLPTQKPLPPTLQEGLEKIRQLLPLLTQFSPATLSALVPQADISEQNVVMSLLQLIQGSPTDSKSQQQTALSNWPLQNLSLLQNIAPGQMITKDLLSALVAQLQAAQPEGDAPQPVPMAALVLGQKMTPSLPAGTVPTLMLGFMPDMQQALIFVTAMNKGVDAKQLFPGSVLITGMPQTQQSTAMNIPFSALLGITQPVPLLPLYPGIGDTWPALQELWNDALLPQSALSDIAATMKQTLPMPTAQQLPAAMLFFMAALRQGGPGAWFGQTALDTLQQAEKIALIGQLSKDMQAIRNAMTDPGPTDAWRPLPVPLQIGSELVRMQWFYRHQYDDLPSNHTAEEEAENNKRRKTRFIVDVPQTRLGDIQIDGLMHDKNLDLILRTESVVPTHVENAIRGRYTQALETSGIVGGIMFQAGRQQYVKV